MMEIVKSTSPYSTVHGHDETDHVVWLCSVEDSKYFTEKFAEIPCTYIADGHHRAASAFNVGKMRREQAREKGTEVTGEEQFNFFMAIHYPESTLKILDYNRVLKNLNGMTNEDFLQKLSEAYDVELYPDGHDHRPA